MSIAANQIDQLWFTWSTLGVEDGGPGYRVHAASGDLIDARSVRYRAIAPYLYYQLPPGFSGVTAPENAPVSLALSKTQHYGCVLVHKVYVGRDALGRTGNFFVHLLAGLPPDFSARKAIHLWNHPFWQWQEDKQQSPVLLPLPLATLERYAEEGATNQRFNFESISDVLIEAMRIFLSPDGFEQPLFVEGNSDYVAMLIWGLTHSIPNALLPPGFTFNTYENDISRSHETLTGIVTSGESASYSHPGLHIESRPIAQNNPELQADISEYAEFAVKHLNSGEKSNLLDILVQEAEKDTGITTVQAYIKLYKELSRKEKALLRPVPQVPQRIPSSGELKAPKPRMNGEGSAEKPVSMWSEPPIDQKVRGRTPQRDEISLSRRSQLIFLLAFIVLFLGSNILTHWLTARNGIGNTPPITSIATVPVKPTPTVPPWQEISYKLIATGFIPTQYPHLTIYIVVQNSSPNTWSGAGYRFICLPPSGKKQAPDCQGVTYQGLGSNSVPSKQYYVFVIILRPDRSIGVSHHISVQFVYNGQNIEPAQDIHFCINGSSQC